MKKQICCNSLLSFRCPLSSNQEIKNTKKEETQKTKKLQQNSQSSVAADEKRIRGREFDRPPSRIPTLQVSRGVHYNPMTSSVHDYSDNGEADEQQKYSESQHHSSSVINGLNQPSVTTPSQYLTPPQVGAGHALAPPAYPYPDPYYRSIFSPYDAQPYPPQPYGGQPMVHLQLMGIQQAGVPLPTDAVEEPVFVNAKQYHGILRRRQSRAKAESENKALKSRKPYLHESRHLHALRRARGCGGRFLKSNKNENQQNEVASGDKSQPNINLNSDRSDLASSEN